MRIWPAAAILLLVAVLTMACSSGDADSPDVLLPPDAAGTATLPPAETATGDPTQEPQATVVPGLIAMPGAPVERTLNVPILVYHHVTPDLPEDFEQRTITVTTAEFEAQLQALEDARYHSVTSVQLANALFFGAPFPEKPVMLTFDDGYEDAYVHAMPLLRQYGFSGTFGIVTGYAGNPGYLSWDQAREMRDAGMELVSHSVTHADLGALSDEDVSREIRDSRARLETELGLPVQTLIYPYGEPFAYGSEDAQVRVKAALAREGYVLAIANPLPGEWPVIAQDAAQPFELSRVMVSTGMPLNRFAARLTGDDLR